MRIYSKRWVQLNRQHVESAWQLILQCNALSQRRSEIQSAVVIQAVVVHAVLNLSNSDSLRHVMAHIALVDVVDHRLVVHHELVVEQDVAVDLLDDVVFDEY